VELLRPESPILVPSRVLRCRTASVGEILKYHGACAFKRPLTIPELTARRIVGQQAPVTQPVAGAPSLGWQKVVARFNDGRIVAGYTNDFHPSKLQLHLFPNPRQGESTFIPLAQLKALFFVREFSGDPTLVESKDFVDPPKGRKVEVTFHDHEVMVGSTLGYRGEGNGFFCIRPMAGRTTSACSSPPRACGGCAFCKTSCTSGPSTFAPPDRTFAPSHPRPFAPLRHSNVPPPSSVTLH